MSVHVSASPRTGAFISGRLDAIDGVRTFAVIAVFVFHGASGLMPGGWSGVDTFFAISGFVITLLLVKEWSSAGRIGLGAFYVKRLARLWPALLLVCIPVAVVSIVWPASGWGGQTGNAAQASAYVMNIFRSGLVGRETAGGALGHTWTLAVEEQFYLAWPVLLIVMLRFLSLRSTAMVTVLLALAAVSERLIMVASGVGLNRLYNGPDTRADQLLLGCALALTFSMVPPESKASVFIARASGRAVWPCAGILTVAAFTLSYPKDPGTWFDLYWGIGPFVMALVATVFIAGLASNPLHPLSRLLAHKWLSWPGRNLSYGVYLWHLPLIYLFLNVIEPIYVRIPVVFVLTVTLAYLSARFMEKPVKQWVNSRLEARKAARTPSPRHLSVSQK